MMLNYNYLRMKENAQVEITLLNSKGFTTELGITQRNG